MDRMRVAATAGAPGGGTSLGSEAGAVVPEALSGGITGVVWRDFSPGGGTPGEVEPDELGLPGVTVELRGADGESVADTTTEDDGTFAFEEVDPGTYRVAIGAQTFAKPFAGVSWLGAQLGVAGPVVVVGIFGQHTHAPTVPARQSIAPGHTEVHQGSGAQHGRSHGV